MKQVAPDTIKLYFRKTLTLWTPQRFILGPLWCWRRHPACGGPAYLVFLSHAILQLAQPLLFRRGTNGTAEKRELCVDAQTVFFMRPARIESGIWPKGVKSRNQCTSTATIAVTTPPGSCINGISPKGPTIARLATSANEAVPSSAASLEDTANPQFSQRLNAFGSDEWTRLGAIVLQTRCFAR